MMFFYKSINMKGLSVFFVWLAGAVSGIDIHVDRKFGFG